MAVIIDMELPQRCEDCRFHQHHSGNDYVCIATPMFYPFNLANYKDGRKDFCPLKSADEMIAEIDKIAYVRTLTTNPFVQYNAKIVGYDSLMKVMHKYCDKEE